MPATRAPIAQPGLALLALVLVGGICGALGCQDKKPAKSSPGGSAMAMAPGMTMRAAPEQWQDQVGKTITVTGTASPQKAGAALVTDRGTLWLDGVSWPDKFRGKKVTVTGQLITRDDLPVFIQRKGDPIRAGIPVPPGTDLAKARRRYLLALPKLRLAR